MDLSELQGGTIGVEFKVRDADGVTDRLVDGILAAASILASAAFASSSRRPKGVGITGARRPNGVSGGVAGTDRASQARGRARLPLCGCAREAWRRRAACAS